MLKISLSTLAINYALFAFIALEFNPLQWEWYFRFAWLMSAVCLVCVIISIDIRRAAYREIREHMMRESEEARRMQ